MKDSIDTIIPSSVLTEDVIKQLRVTGVMVVCLVIRARITGDFVSNKTKLSCAWIMGLYCHLFMDRFFTSIIIGWVLLKLGIYVTGTTGFFLLLFFPRRQIKSFVVVKSGKQNRGGKKVDGRQIGRKKNRRAGRKKKREWGKKRRAGKKKTC